MRLRGERIPGLQWLLMPTNQYSTQEVTTSWGGLGYIVNSLSQKHPPQNKR